MNSKHRKKRDAAIIQRIIAPPRADNDHIKVYDIYDDNGIYVDSKAVIDFTGRMHKDQNRSKEDKKEQQQSSSSSRSRSGSEKKGSSTHRTHTTTRTITSAMDHTSTDMDTRKIPTKLSNITNSPTMLPHRVFEEDIKFATCNTWPDSFTLKEINTYCHDNIPGVIVCDLPPGHPLHARGEQGLFASKEFEPFDIIGSYTGTYVNADVRGFPNSQLVSSGHYLAQLEMPYSKDGKRVQLGINAESCGNETRFINSYLNIAAAPNAVMKTTFIDKQPHVMIVCTKPIGTLEEILLDYGDEYHQTYLIPRAPVDQKTAKELYNELPPIDSYESEREIDIDSDSYKSDDDGLGFDMNFLK